jgi:hypothetical protein
VSTLPALLLLLPIPGYPAPKAEGLPADLVARLPEDTATALVVDVPCATRSAVGKHFFAKLAPKFSDSLPIEQILKDTEVAVLAQYRIQNFAGDFCFLFRLRPRADLPYAVQKKTKGPAEKVGPYEVFPLGESIFFGMLDERTLAVVYVSPGPNMPGDGKEEALAAVFRQDARGPGEALRRKLSGLKPARALTIFSEHKKSGLSASLVLSAFGYDAFKNGGLNNEITDSVKRFAGGVRVDKDAEMEICLDAHDERAAAVLHKTLEDRRTAADDWSGIVQKGMTITLEKASVTIRTCLTPRQVEAMLGE